MEKRGQSIKEFIDNLDIIRDNIAIKLYDEMRVTIVTPTNALEVRRMGAVTELIRGMELPTSLREVDLFIEVLYKAKALFLQPKTTSVGPFVFRPELMGVSPFQRQSA